MTKKREVIFNSLIWGLVMIAVAVVLRGTPYKTRVLPVLTLGAGATFSLLAAKKEE